MTSSTVGSRVLVTTSPLQLQKRSEAVNLLAIPMHRRVKKWEEICDRADCAIRANVRGSIYQVDWAEKRNVTADIVAQNRASSWRSGMSRGSRLCSIANASIPRSATKSHFNRERLYTDFASSALVLLSYFNEKKLEALTNLQATGTP